MSMWHMLRTEARVNAKTLILYLLLVQLMVAGLLLAYPSMVEGLDFQPEGAENILFDMQDNESNVTVTLSWEEVAGASNYTVLIDSMNVMLVPQRVEGIPITSYVHVIEKENGSTPVRFFAVLAVTPDGAQFIGMHTNTGSANPWESFYWSDFSDIAGIISLFWDMWWVLLIGLFLGYFSVNSVTRDFEERRMDILLTTRMSRRDYVLGKFVFICSYTLLTLAVTVLVMIVTIQYLGESGSISYLGLLTSTMFSFPLFMTIVAVSLLAGLYLEEGRKAVGVSFLIVLTQYVLYLAGNLAESLSYLKLFSALNYWDHQAMLVDGTVAIGDLVLMTLVGAALLWAALRAFDGKDIPG